MLVAQLCLTLCDPVDCNLPGISVHGILQARILEWVAIPFSRGCSQPRDWIHISCIGRQVLHTEPPGKPHSCLEVVSYNAISALSVVIASFPFIVLYIVYSSIFSWWVSFISVLIFMISSLLVTLGFVCTSFSSCFRCKVRSFIWDFSCFLR